jgi:predicted DNA-binding transcriptional regulator AlpA
MYLKWRAFPGNYRQASTNLHGWSLSMTVEALLTEAQVSEILGRGVPTLQKDRVAGTGPQFIKMGRLVLYRPSDVQAWLAERVRRSTSDSAVGEGS